MKQERTSEFFDEYASDFNAIYGTRSRPLDRFLNRWLRTSMLLRFEETVRRSNPADGASAIDIGCGPGHYSEALALNGATRVLGIDFAPRMIEIASERAQKSGIGDRCEFVVGDFLEMEADERFDFAVVMGFMDYIRDPSEVIGKVAAQTRRTAFFSFPAARGFLAWQRKLRYRSRCDLFLYERDQVRALFADWPGEVEILKLRRDYFVAASKA